MVIFFYKPVIIFVCKKNSLFILTKLLYILIWTVTLPRNGVMWKSVECCETH